jgi:hypothetical protein
VLEMPARKMRVEVYDETGNRYTITFEGSVTRDKALRLIDLVELLGGMPGVNSSREALSSELSKFDKIHFVLEKHFALVWFSSKDVQSAYKQEFKEPASLSTVSTYLSRMADRGLLLKNKMSNSLRYRVITETSQSILGFIKDNK